MWTFRVVVPSPLLNDDPGFIEAVEDLSVQELVAEPVAAGVGVAERVWRKCHSSEVSFSCADIHDFEFRLAPRGCECLDAQNRSQL